ncbi:AcvB/VirJ family lysyl-phosphatidylglycerol hydrolase [Labrys okinawensis]|uniref:virulence factor family protein n=1 Tax=Labrys okinawensis TaxID=346911 RepID=UPI0039BD4CE0
MKSLLMAGIALVGLATTTPALAVDGGRLGDVRVAQPDGPTKGYVVLFSDRGGWKDRDEAALDAMAKQGSVVVGVDLDTYLANLLPMPRPGVHPCSELVGDVEGLSQKLQRSRIGDKYHFPILAGVGAGGALAQLILAGSPPNTIAGAATVDPDVLTPNGLTCSVSSTVISSGTLFGSPPLKSNGFWTIGLTASASPLQRAAVEVDRKDALPIDVHLDAPSDLAAALTQLIAPHLDRLDLQGLAALPLVPLPVQHPSRLMAVMLSGDGGWRDIDKTISEQLQRDGIPVVGFDSLRYFWHQKTPEQTAHDLATAIRGYQAKWHAEKVALIGYSFGANVLPATYNALPNDVKTDVDLVSLLGPEPKADWEIKIAGWFGAGPSDAAAPIAPELIKIPSPLVQCFYGEDEGDTSCPSLSSTKAEVIKTRGGHHFNGEYPAIAQDIVNGFQKRAGSAG